MTMRNPVPLDVAEYRSGLACSLWSAILEKASDECSQDLLNLLSLACDINHEVHVSLSSGQGGRHGEQRFLECPQRSGKCPQCQQGSAGGADDVA